MITVTNFKIFRLLYERLDFFIYEGVDLEGHPILIKTGKTGSSNQEERLKQEEQILQKFDTPRVIKSRGFFEENQQSYLILEKFGVPLSEFLVNKTLDLETFLNIGIELAAGLGEIHHGHVIHKDVKPQNILIDPATLAIKFQNFDVASLQSRETIQPLKINLFEGTLSYISPEQTGKLNRALDYRTDIYSLGVIFYEMLTKRLPFVSDNPVELFQMHIAMKAPSPQEINPEIPPLISDIVMKCLSKNMEERYHSAFGLRNDLDEYRKQLKTAQTITCFPAGKYDNYDHFHIPQKLYGREQELQILMSSFDRVCSGEGALLFVNGYSGIGKSSIVFEMQNIVAQRNGYFIFGKYDQFKKNIPYNAIIQAFQGLVQQLLCEGEDQVKKWKRLILQELGANVQLIIDVIPEVGLIVGKQPPVIQLDFQQAEKRFNFFLIKFIELFLKPEHPLVLFLDDLQCIDQSSLNFLQMFVLDSERKHLLIIGSYRDNEVGPSHPLNYALNMIKKEGKTYEMLKLIPLPLPAINQLISETFHNSLSESQTLATLVYQKTGGNPFFSIQFLKMLYKEGLLDFNSQQQQWIANLNAIKNLRVTDNVAELMSQRIQTLPITTQDLLKIGSAIGNIFDLQTLTIVSGGSVPDTSSHLLPALEEELILLKHGFSELNKDPASNHKYLYTFQHDRIQQAAYRLIPPADLNRLHYQIGQALLQQTAPEQRKDEIITIVDQLNHGVDLLQDESEKQFLAKLNFEAGQKAQASNAQQAAIQYLKTGIALLGNQGWEKNYDLQFKLHENLSIAQHLAGLLEEAENTFDLVFANSKTTAEKFKLYVLKIKFYLEINDVTKLYRNFEEALRLIHFDIDFNPSAEQLYAEVNRIRERLRSMSDADLARLPALQNEHIRDVCELMNSMGLAYYCSIGSMFILIASKFIDLTLSHGLSKENRIAFIWFGMVLESEFIGCYAEGIRIGQFALDKIRKQGTIYERLHAEFIYYYTSARWTMHLDDCNDFLKDLGPKCIEVGNIMDGAGCYVYMIIHYLLTGKPLDWVLEENKHYLAVVKPYKHPRSYTLISLFQEIVRSLRGLNDYPDDPRPRELVDLSCTSTTQGEDTTQYYIWRIFLLFIYEKYQEALTFCEKLTPHILNLPSNPIWICYYTYYALTLAALYRLDKEKQESRKELLNAILERSKRWAETAPHAYLHLYQIIKAEIAYCFNDTQTALTSYELALHAAEKGRYNHEAGIICELAGKFHYEGDRKNLSEFYLKKAFDFYLQWGATVKIDHFKAKYTELFPTLSPYFKKHFEKKEDHRAQTSITEAFTSNSILQAAQALSKEIVLDKLIQTLMNVVKVEAGAEKVFFIMPKKDKFYVLAETSLSQEHTTMLEEVPIQQKSDDFSVAMIYHVARTKQTLLLNDASNEGIFVNDLYVKIKKPKSVLCFPLLHLGKLTSILYFENNLVTGAFTPDLLHVLELLSSQMAISIENAKFYAELEEIVAERTREVNEKNAELSHALENVTKMQKQMIQQEKLASLGLLSPAIAHELKNPLNFVMNFSELASTSITELNEKIGKEGTVIDPSELNEEINSLNDLIKKIVHHSKRADGIVKGLLPHAYQGGARAENSSLPMLIDQAANLTLQVFRKKEPNFNLEIIRKYDPEVKPQKVFPAELTRVFINLVDNACFAMNQKLKQESSFKPKLEISIKKVNNEIYIAFKDNGGGVPQEDLNKIFQPFFTTKELGEGTGLGLSISYDIITQQHNGKISVLSDNKTYTEFTIILPAKDGVE